MDAPAFTKRNCPISAAWVIAMREQFGDDVKVVLVEENGVVIDRREKQVSEE